MLRVSSTFLCRAQSLRCFSSASPVVGSVKFYNRQKQFGFITADDDSITDDVFAHRSNIAGASDAHPNGLPFLITNERVQFDLETENGKLVAKNIVTEGGSPIPVYRDIYLENRKKSVKTNMGMQVYDILDDDTMSEADKVSRIMEEYEKAKRYIQDLDAKKNANAEQGGESEEEAL